MYFDYQNYNYAVNCDWLQFSALINDPNPEELQPKEAEGFRTECLPGNNIFKRRAIVYRAEDGEKLLTLLWDPYSAVIKPNLLTCQVANSSLYMGAINWSYSLLTSIMPCSFNSMGRIDLCIDFPANETIMAKIRNLFLGNTYIQGKREGSIFWHNVNNARGRMCHCMSWGSKTTEIKVKLYNKSREIGIENPQGDNYKAWIVKEWEKANFGDLSNVWRLEFSLCSSGQLMYEGKPITIADVASEPWILSVFLTLYNKRFICRRNTGRREGHKNNDPLAPFLSLPKTIKGLKWKGNNPEWVPNSESVKMLRKSIEMIQSPLAMGNVAVFDELGALIMKLTDNKGVDAYFGKCYGMPADEWLTNLRDNAGAKVVEVVPLPSFIF